MTEPRNDNTPNWQPSKKTETKSKYYSASTEGRTIRRFHLIKANGIPLSIPYAMLPIFTMDEHSNLLILTHDIRVVIKGRNMKKLYDAFSGETVLWIKECSSQMDDETEDVFVEEIVIESDLMM
jgi:hypothetical protein